VHYLLSTRRRLDADLADVEAKITERTRALVVINPNNPTGAVYSRDMLEGLAAIAGGTLVLSDESMTASLRRRPCTSDGVSGRRAD